MNPQKGALEETQTNFPGMESELFTHCYSKTFCQLGGGGACLYLST